ncbi:c-type cytochrome [Fluviicola taffensis]|uniref:Cytochrome c class I n=1 Tax=Fluviicola taffensis (strain DSM 16823 / NCIMB 13979 / RW262) TaxID=755732 RepID=F2IHI4_FLUTR|nr:cytochrome c [Fluviicola taffensis]AEA43749.1 cytochrome c class I [Fluviicola taffensis DSM 16823]
METNWNQLIERYLNNELSAEGKAAFETELQKNKELQKEFELHKLTQELIQRNSFRKLVNQSGKWFHLKKLLVKSALTLVIAGVVAVAVYTAVNWNSFTNKPQFLEQVLLEKLEKHLAFENIDPEYFQFTGQSDVFLSESGVLLSITDKSFLLDGNPYAGEAIVQLQEAQKGSDIVKAGLSTKSGDRLLETQGMFSLNAFTPDGKKLELTTEGVYMQVPVNELKKDMLIFTGVPGKDGAIDWQNPVELERLPKPKDMAEVDLFPPRYEPKLNELKWFKEKTKRDSLYLSFEENNEPGLTDSIYGENDKESLSIKNVPGKGNQFNVSFNGNEKILGAGTPVNAYPTDLELRGKLLFETKCAVCHSPYKDGTGPKLFEVRKKWADGGAKEGSIYQWVDDWNIAATSDPYAREICNIKATAMNTFPELKGKQKEIDAIFDYIDSQLLQVNTAGVDTIQKSHIPPSKVLAIWNKKFNKTNLATQDFEDRMKAIHETCDEKVFDVYAKNLNEPLWKLDQRVVKMGYPQFQQFADQKVGAIKMDDVHQKNLTAFYEKAIETIRETGKKDLEAALKKDLQWDNEVQDERRKEFLRKGLRESTNLNEEYGFNLKNVYKQLGVTAGFQIYGGGTIVNIDKYVMDATITRQSTLITDPETGKTAQITYEPLKVEVSESEQYDKLFLYLFSKEINSYQRIDFKEGKLDYNLNGDMNYHAMIVGMNENGYFYHQINELKAEDLEIVSLKEISEKEFDKRINILNEHRIGKAMSMKDELKWLFKEKANYAVQKKRRENVAFRNLIRPMIYSCMKSESNNSIIGGAKPAGQDEISF